MSPVAGLSQCLLTEASPVQHCLNGLVVSNCHSRLSSHGHSAASAVREGSRCAHRWQQRRGRLPQTTAARRGKCSRAGGLPSTLWPPWWTRQVAMGSTLSSCMPVGFSGVCPRPQAIVYATAPEDTTARGCSRSWHSACSADAMGRQPPTRPCCTAGCSCRIPTTGKSTSQPATATGALRACSREAAA